MNKPATTEGYAASLAGWTGWLAVAAGLVWAEGIFGWQSWVAGGALLLAGLLLVVGANPGQRTSPFAVGPTTPQVVRRLVVTGLLVTGGVALGGPFALAGLLVGAALVAELVGRPATAASFCAVAWFVGLWWAGYHLLGSRLHELPAATPLVAAALNALGLNVGVEGYMLHVQSATLALPFAVSWQLAGDWALLACLLAPVAIWLSGRPAHGAGLGAIWVMRLLLALAIWGFMRVVLEIIFICEVPQRLALTQHPAMQAMTFLPLLLLLAALCPFERPPASALPQAGFSHRRITALLMLGVGLGVTCFWVPTGHVKAGRVLIDETHSRWELTTKPLDTQWYGRYSTYSYWSLARWWEHYYSVTTLQKGRLDAETLARQDILVLKCPTQRYEDREIAAILAFVRQGGSVLLVGDHTNVFGMNTYLNQIAEPMGVRLNYDATYDLTTGGLSIWTPPARVRHPAAGQVREYDFMTTCTLQCGPKARAVIVGPGLLCGEVDWATAHFFERPKQLMLPNGLMGLFIQAAAGDYGQGRFFVWTDSTTWSNFSVLMDGNPPLLEGIMTFLNRQASPVDGRVAGLGLMLLGGLLLLLTRKQGASPSPQAAAVLLGLMLAALAALAYNHWVYQPAQPVRPMRTIAFDLRHGNYELRPASGISRDLVRGDTGTLDLSTFFVWAQRVGLYPREARDWETLEGSDMAVLALPNQKLTRSAAQRLLAWMRRGGRLLLLLDGSDPAPSADLLLGPAGMGAVPVPLIRPLKGKGTQSVAAVVPVLTMQGGKPLWRDGEGRVVAAVAPVGEGRLLVCTCANSFDVRTMGGAFTVPNAAQKGVYTLEYALLGELGGRS